MYKDCHGHPLMGLCVNKEVVTDGSHQEPQSSKEGSEPAVGEPLCPTFSDTERDISCGDFLLLLGKAEFPLHCVLLA